MENKTLWIGIDVSAKSFYAAADFPMVFEKQGKLDASELPTKKFNMTPAGVKSLFHWIELQKSEFCEKYDEEEEIQFPVHLLMESTGIYSEQLEKLLYAANANAVVIIANPAPIKAFRTSLNIKNKTDKLDCQVIARFGLEREPEQREKPAPEYQTLRKYSRARSFFKDIRTALNNYHDNVDAPLVKSKCTKIAQKIDAEIEGLNSEIDKLIKETPAIDHEIGLMTTMPGVGTASAVTFLGELGTLTSYKRREELIAMCGLNPVNKQSGTSINSSHLSKAGSAMVRRFLYMDSKTALPRIPVLQDLYNRLLARGKTKMQARCAVMRKMLLILLGMVKNDKTYNEMQKKSEKNEKKA